MAKTKTAQKSTLGGWGDVDECLRQIALHNAFVKGKEAEMNKQILSLQNRFESETLEARTKVLALEKDIELFAIEHRDEFVGSKTIAMNYGICSFRLTTPRLTTLRGFTWDTVLSLIKKLRLPYVRTKEEVDKEAIKAEVTDAKELASIGLQLQQSETFYYEVFEKELI